MKTGDMVPIGGEGADKAVFVSQDGRIALNVRIEGESVWLTQTAMAELFGCTPENVVQHLKNVYAEGELQETATTKNFLVVRMEGKREVARQLKHYNLDAIIAIGYRVNSHLATQFRIWATSVIRSYLLQGFSSCRASPSTSG